MSQVNEQTIGHVHRDDEATRIGMWLFLFTELLLFGGLFIAYAVYRYLHPHEFMMAGKELNSFFGCIEYCNSSYK